MTKGQDEAIAIVGFGGFFPGSNSLEEFWTRIAAGIDSTTDVPPGRWLLDPEKAFDPAIAQADRVYATRGGFVGELPPEPNDTKLEPGLLARLDPVFRLALLAAHSAWNSARTDSLDCKRVGVVFGNIVLPTETASALTRKVLGRQIEESLGLLPCESDPDEPLNAFPAGLPASIVAKSLGLGGPAWTLDAACASSLYAIKLAADALRGGKVDAMLTGGVSRPDPLYTQMGFSQLRALSARGKPAPFDARGDGLIVGEGAGLFLLKRLDDAIRDGDTVHGVIRGIGLSNDTHGDLLAPSSEGQLRAMRAAYEQAGWSPRDVDLIECHATGTPVGDAVEIESLKALWAERPSVGPGRGCVLGSVKSNVGHMLTAAGAAGLTKLLLALRHRILPPTANFVQGSPKLGLEASPFRVLTRPEPWADPEQGRPRRAALSGLGFGGINAHLLLEEWRPDQLPASGVRASFDSVSSEFPPPEIAIVGLAANFGPWRGLDALRNRVLGGHREDRLAPPRHWWGITQARVANLQVTQRAEGIRGYYLDSLKIPIDRFRIPPRGLEDLLLQQSLMLDVAAEAIADARWNREQGPRTGVLIGLGLDLNTTNYHLRWWLTERVSHWNKASGVGLSDEDLESWLARLKDAVGPPLTADRTMGSLGGLVASRIAREFKIGGPSFSVSCDESSGNRALEIAVDWLARRELDAAIVGAVDLAGDVRLVQAKRRLDRARAGETRPEFVPGEGASALVLKRLDDARRDGDRVYAVIRDAGQASLDFGAIRSTEGAFAIPDPEPDLGWTGTALGLAAIMKAALSLYHQILPPGATDFSAQANPTVSPEFWLRNRADGPRRAVVDVRGIDGSVHRTTLEGFEPSAEIDEVVADETVQGLAGPIPGIFVLKGDNPTRLQSEASALADFAAERAGQPIIDLALAWWSRGAESARTAPASALLAESLEALERGLNALSRILESDRPQAALEVEGPGYRFYPYRTWEEERPGIGFVFPGLGNVVPGMGRQLALRWPEILRAQDAANGYLRDQFARGIWWKGGSPRPADHRAPILGQVTLGCLVTDLLRRAGIQPDAAIGYSMGESTALVALGAWTDRDEMAHRLEKSSLFATELAGPCDAARRVWGLRDDEAVDWIAGIVTCSAERVKAAIGQRRRAYVLIRNHAQETVIGGRRDEVNAVVEALACPFLELSMVSTVHCEIGRAVEEEYHALHDLPTLSPRSIKFYSGVTGQSYVPDRSSAARAITAQASQLIDFPAIVERAYADGIRIFLEMGPGGSCTRLIGKILGDRPHLACAASLPDRDEVGTVVELLAGAIAAGVQVDLGKIYRSAGSPTASQGHSLTAALSTRTLIIGRGGSPFLVPAPSRRAEPETPRQVPEILASTGERPAAVTRFASVTTPSTEMPAPAMQTPESPQIASLTGTSRGDDLGSRSIEADPHASPLVKHWLAAETARAGAHEAFLRVSRQQSELIGMGLAYQLGLIEKLGFGPEVPESADVRAIDDSVNGGEDCTVDPWKPASGMIDSSAYPDLHLDRGQCLEFAVGSIASVLGREFAGIDDHPRRVRLPDEPLMLVDRILAVEGLPLSMKEGRVVTEHDILPEAWYLDAGRIAPCIAIESGQADLFLSAYLGIDFETRGLAVYRLLDATVTFHRGLPGPGKVIRYDIRINQFFRQGDTHLFRFEFEGTVDGEPLLTMRDGCAGFFTEEALKAGRGVVPRPLDSRPRPGKRPADWIDLVPIEPSTLDHEQVQALRNGDLASAFGESFRAIDLADPLPLPGGRMTLVDRVVNLEPTGGRFGLGMILAEADIHPGDWFMVCHFVDDRVMPGTLMYECCLHSLRILLMRMGWVGGRDTVAWEPLPGIANRLRCRGQVIESTRVVTYEVSIKELGFGPEPYAIADALMYADGKPIVEFTDMALRLSGTDRHELERIWRPREESQAAAQEAASAVSRGVTYGKDRILAFSTGKPSIGFGDRYRPYDEDRFIARLPGPPYLFLDQVTPLSGEPWTMAAGTTARAEYDVPPDAWYFQADRQPVMPYAVLLEVPLQACGWCSAFMGSALTSSEPLKYRNLGGTARQHRLVDRRAGTLTSTVTVTKVTRSAGMIIQHYDFEVRDREGIVIDGQTYFGYFRPDALSEQVGIRDAHPWTLSAEERSGARSLVLPDQAPYPEPRWRMVDQVDALVADGGPLGLGIVEGSKDVDHEAWFFKAHFLGDPVWPGSLGLESFLQLLRVFAAERWDASEDALFDSSCSGQPHRWTYRGQILPTNQRVAVQAVVTARDDRDRSLKANGFLQVDGKIIYQMNDFTLRLRPRPAR